MITTRAYRTEAISVVAAGLLAISPAAFATSVCGIPVITTPTEALVATERPVIAWTAVDQADHYRVQVNLRVPEGPLLGSLDLNVREPRFELPHALPAHRVLVIARVSAHCKEQGYGPSSEPAQGGRFLAVRGPACPPPDHISTSIAGDGLALAWDRASSASGYEIVRHDRQSGIPIESWTTMQPRLDVPLRPEKSDLFGLRTLCNAKPGPWAYVLPR